MKSVTIQALNSKKENISLITIMVLIVVVAYSLIRFTGNQNVEQEVLDYQISAYKDLSNIDNSFYTDLTNSLIDIQAIYELEGELPEIHALEDEGISPFVRDSIWENRGALEWKLLEEEGETYYLGISENVKIVGNFLVKIDRTHMEKSKIYFNQKQDSERNLIHTLVHLQEHWKEVLAYTGEQERKKF